MSADSGITCDAPPRKPILRICLLGSEGSGKTCFLAGLAVLKEANRRTRVTVSPTDTVTVEYLDALARTLHCGQWPPPTNMTTLLKLRLGVDGKAIEAVMIDYPGEDFRNELRKLKTDDIRDEWHCRLLRLSLRQLVARANPAVSGSVGGWSGRNGC